MDNLPYKSNEQIMDKTSVNCSNKSLQLGTTSNEKLICRRMHIVPYWISLLLLLLISLPFRQCEGSDLDSGRDEFGDDIRPIGKYEFLYLFFFIIHSKSILKLSILYIQ